MAASVESNISSFGVCIIEILRQVALSTGTTEVAERPAFLDEEEWTLLEQMRRPEPLNMVVVVQRMKTLASASTSDGNASMALEMVDAYVIPDLRCSINGALSQLHSQIGDQVKAKLYDHLNQLYAVLTTQPTKRYVVEQFGELLRRIVSSIDQGVRAASCRNPFRRDES